MNQSGFDRSLDQLEKASLILHEQLKLKSSTNVSQNTFGDADDRKSTQMTLANTVDLEMTAKSAVLKHGDLSSNLMIGKKLTDKS